jgi:transketolase
MAALSKHKVIYVLTHDSILLGEDGPTHQPVESLTILRSIPNLLVIRPCDTNEVSGAYQCALQYDGPTALIFTRHSLPSMQNSDSEKMKKGAYVIYEPQSSPDFILVGTGSEVSLAFDVIQSLKEQYSIRLVSMPCTQLFDLESDEYKAKILPKNIKKFSIEAGSTLSFYKYVDYPYGIDTFGESGKMNDLREHFGLTVEKIKEFIINLI